MATDILGSIKPAASASFGFKNTLDKFFTTLLNAFSAEIKGSQINLRPDFIVVTSQYRIGEIWTDIETVDALNRRFTKIKIHIDSQGNRVIQPQGY